MVVVLEGRGNVSVREHIVRDTRQQMEGRSPERLTVGGEALCPLNKHQNFITRRNVET